MFLPKEVKFFDLFDKQGENIVRAAEFYKKLVDSGNFTPENIREMHEIEHYGDELTHTTINTLNETFITPFDREDILALANRLDDIVDSIYLLANRFYMYKITQPTEYSKKMGHTIAQTAKALQKALASLRSNKNMKETLILFVWKRKRPHYDFKTKGTLRIRRNRNRLLRICRQYGGIHFG